MSEGPYLLGIDFGTGGARVGIFDPEGTPVVFSEREFTLEHPRPGQAEQDPDEWWTSRGVEDRTGARDVRRRSPVPGSSPSA